MDELQNGLHQAIARGPQVCRSRPREVPRHANTAWSVAPSTSRISQTTRLRSLTSCLRPPAEGACISTAHLRGQLPDSAEQIAAFFFSQTFLAARPGTVELFRGTQRSTAQARRRALMMQAAPPVIDFADITAPTLLLAGGADRLIPPAETFDLARRIVHTHQQELSDLPHVGAIEDPERVAHAIRNFLLPSEFT